MQLSLLPAEQDRLHRTWIRGSRTLDAPIVQDTTIRLDANIVVRAGAGSGKTTVLVERMIALIRSGVPVQEIVAITFTNKAAGELQKRFLAQLHKVRADLEGKEADPGGLHADEWSREAQRVYRALKGNGSAFIGTIHSFCGRLLRARAFEAGLSPDFRQVEDAEEERLRATFWTGYLERLHNRTNSDLDLVQEAGVSQKDLFDFFGILSRNAELNFPFEQPARPPTEVLVQRASSILDRLLEEIDAAEGEDAFIGAVRRADRYRSAFGLTDDWNRIAWLRLLNGSVKSDRSRLDITMSRWNSIRSSPLNKRAKEIRDGDDGIADGKSILHFFNEDVHPVLSQWDAWVYAAAFRVAFGAVEAYREMRLAEGILSWNDLLCEAARLLETSRSAHAWARKKWTRVLVDEFQDTDPVQARMLFCLASEEPDSEQWQHSVLDPGRLFLVGDDKQSIYRFRRADFQVFDVCARAVVDQGGFAAPLTANFRSDERVCSWINAAVGPLFDAPGKPYQAPWADLTPRRGVLDDQAVVRCVTLLSSGRRVAPVIRADAAFIADDIERLLGSSVRDEKGEQRCLTHGDFLILLKRGSYLSTYVSELAGRGIPVAVGAGRAREMGDTLACICDFLTAVLEPTNGVALAATLRGFLFGVSDADLARFVAGGGRIEAGLESLEDKEETPISLTAARRVFKEARSMFERSGPHEALNSIVARNGWMGLLASRPEGDVAAGILSRILSLFALWEARGHPWGECVQLLESYRSGEVDMDVHSLSMSMRDRVQVMTIHQAKGLQADIVYLADPKAPRIYAPDMHTWRDETGHHAIIPLTRDTGFGSRSVVLAPLEWENAKSEAERFELAELHRLLYVSCTRAGRRLVVSRMEKGSSGPWSDLVPALEDVPTRAAVPIERAPEGESPVNLIDSGYVKAILGRIEESRQRIQALATRTVSTVRPSDFEQMEGIPSEGGLGRAYGTAMHRVLEAVVAARHQPMDDDHILEFVDQGLSGAFPSDDRAKLRQSGISAVKAFVNSDMWKEIGKAERILTEVPFTTSETIENRAEITSGTIDLAFSSGSDWTLVDYKTDILSREHILQRYSGQLDAYARSWSRVFPNALICAVIWSTHHGEQLMLF